jgi:spermidine synthase
VLLAATLALAGCVNPPAGERLVHVERSTWQTLIVTDSDTRRCLRFDDAADALSQSCSLLSQPEHLAFEYTRAMVAVLLLWEPQPRRILLIGVGGGSIPMAVTAVQPGSDIDAVDIDEAVLTVAQRYFGLRPGPRLRLHALDGREFVSAARAREAVYDAVLLDAFDAEGIPPSLFGEPFLQDIRALLAPSGVFLANTFAAGASYAQESAVAQRVFGRIHSVHLGATGGNRLIVAAKNPARLPEPSQLWAGLPSQEAQLERLGIDVTWVRQLRFSTSD